MRLSIQTLFVISTCLVSMTQWIDTSLVVGGKPILFVSELILYIHTILLLFFTKGKMSVPKWIFVMLLPLMFYFSIHLVFSFIAADPGNALLTTRRLLYFPFVALIVGYNTACAAKDPRFVDKVLNLNLRLTIPLLLLNMVVGFHMFQEFGFISRATGVILSALVFTSLLGLIQQRSTPKKLLWVALATFLIVFVTSSRGVYIAFLSGLGLMIWQYRKRIGVGRILKLASGGVVVGVIIIAISLSSPLVIKTLGKFESDITKIIAGDMGSYGEKFNTLGARFYLYEAVFNLGLESPIFGNGSGFKVEEWHLGGSYNIKRSKTPHHYYLDIWYRLGIVGLLLFFLFYKKILSELKLRQENVYYMLIVAMVYSSFDVLLSSNTSAIIPIFMLVGASLKSPIRTQQ
jgi:O-antigen ligase